MSNIKQLPSSAVRLIGSSQVITSVYSVVKELIENALDAEATSIDIKLENFGLDRIEVRDNGSGIQAPDVAVVAKPHCTSKLSSTEDLAQLTTYGFRGEALGSLCAVSDVILTTKSDSDEVSWQYTLNACGDVVAKKPSHLPRGTTICATRLFARVPVRRQYYSGSVKRRRESLKRVEELVAAFALIRPRVRFTLKHDKATLWQVFANGNQVSVLNTIIGTHATSQLQHEKRVSEDPPADVELHVPRSSSHVGDTSRCNADTCFVFVNERPVTCKQIEKLLKHHYSRAHGLSSERYPVAMVHLRLPPDRVDVNLDPNKTTVYWHDKNEILKFLENVLEDIYGNPESQSTDKHSSTKDDSESTSTRPGISQSSDIPFRIDDVIQDKYKTKPRELIDNAPLALNRASDTSLRENETSLVSSECDKTVQSRDIHNRDIKQEDVSIDLCLDDIDFNAPFEPVTPEKENLCDSINNNPMQIQHKCDISGRSNGIETEHSLDHCDLGNQNKENQGAETVNIASFEPLEEITASRDNPITESKTGESMTLDSTGSKSLIESHASWCNEQNTSNILSSSSFNVPLPKIDSIISPNGSSTSTKKSMNHDVTGSSNIVNTPVGSSSSNVNATLTSPVLAGNMGDTTTPSLPPFADSFHLNSMVQSNSFLSSTQNDLESNNKEIDSTVGLDSNKNGTIATKPSLSDVTPDQLLHGHSTVLIPQKRSIPGGHTPVQLKPPPQRASYSGGRPPEKKRKQDTPSRQRDISLMLQSASTSGQNKQSRMRKQVSIKFNMARLKQMTNLCATQSSQGWSHMTSPKSLKLIGALDSGALWICQFENDLVCFQPIRVQEELLFRKLLQTYVLQVEPLENPIVLTPSMLGLEHWQSLMNADKSENGAQDPYVYFTDPRLYSNGFRIRTSKDSESNQTCVKLVAMASSSTRLPSYGVAELKEVLSLMASDPTMPLERCRPKKLRTFLQSEAERMTQSLPGHTSRDDAQHLANRCSWQLLPSDVKHCFHGNPFMRPIYALEDLKQQSMEMTGCSSQDM